MQVSIVDFPETKVAKVEHRGSPDRVFEATQRFIAWRKSSQLSPVASSKTFGVPYGDPQQTRLEDFRFDVCGSVKSDVPENEYGVLNGVIPGGRCAVVTHKGSLDALSEAVYYLYENWLPESGEDLRDFPVYFHYHNFVHEVGEADLLTDVYLPLKG